MDPYWPMSNSTTLLAWCRLLMKLYGANPLFDIGAVMRALPGQFVDHRFFPATPNYPRFYYARFDDKCFLLIGGTENLAMATQVIAGYLGRIPPDIRNPQNEWLNDSAEAIVQAIRDAGFVSPSQLRVCGHSLGGSLGCLIAPAGHVAEWQPASSHVITFGSPKIHSFRNNRIIRDTNQIVRVMNDNDPVPLLPPNALDYPAILSIAGPIHSARLAMFDHPVDGWIMAIDGSMRSGNVPNVSNLSFGVNLAAWLLDLDAIQNNTHSLNEYEKRLISQEQNQIRQNHLPGHAIPAPPQSNRHEMTQQESRVLEAVAQRQRQQNEPPVTIPKERFFEWVRVGRIHCVAFGGKLITITSTKRKAKRLANSGNDFLRVLQRQAVVDPLSIVTQFDSYFQYAAAIGTGFRPVMQTVFPALGN